MIWLFPPIFSPLSRQQVFSLPLCRRLILATGEGGGGGGGAKSDACQKGRYSVNHSILCETTLSHPISRTKPLGCYVTLVLKDAVSLFTDCHCQTISGLTYVKVLNVAL